MITDTEKMRWYRPREVAKKRLITSTTGSKNENSNYFFILRLIKTGQLKAVRYGNGTQNKYLLISDEAIKTYYRRLHVEPSSPGQ